MYYAEVQVRSRHAPEHLAPSGEPIEASALTAMCQRVGGLRQRLEDALVRVSNSVNRAAGVEPKSQPENQAAAPSNGLLDDLAVEMNRIDDLIQELAAQADRLERIA